MPSRPGIKISSQLQGCTSATVQERLVKARGKAVSSLLFLTTAWVKEWLILMLLNELVICGGVPVEVLILLNWELK